VLGKPAPQTGELVRGLRWARYPRAAPGLERRGRPLHEMRVWRSPEKAHHLNSTSLFIGVGRVALVLATMPERFSVRL